MERQIVYRTIDSESKQIKIVVTNYSQELHAELEKDEIVGTNLLEVEDSFEDAMTTARVYSRAYRELFYQNYDISIVVK